MVDATENADNDRRAPHRRWLVRFGLAGVVLIGLGAGASLLYVTDIRPKALREGPISGTSAQSAKERLARAAAAHGVKRWREFRILEVAAKDSWHWWMAHTPLNPWPEPRQQLRMQFLRGTWTSRMELLNGPEPGGVWGIQAWHPYRISPGGKPVFQADDDISFYLPTYHYFFEFPFRIGAAGIVADAGEASHQGKSYDRVFATWDTLEPNRDKDQYVVWINQDTGLIDRIEYTVREIGGFAAGATNYYEYRSVDGVMIPHRLSMRLVMPGGIEREAHEVLVEQARWDAVDVGLLLPNPELSSGSNKP